jgi:hypothetical protein
MKDINIVISVHKIHFHPSGKSHELFHSNGTHRKVHKIPCDLIMSSISFVLSNFIHVLISPHGELHLCDQFFLRTKFHPSSSFNSHGQWHVLNFIPKHNYIHGELYLFVLKIPSNFFVSFGHIPSIYGKLNILICTSWDVYDFHMCQVKWQKDFNIVEPNGVSSPPPPTPTPTPTPKMTFYWNLGTIDYMTIPSTMN